MPIPIPECLVETFGHISQHVQILKLLLDTSDRMGKCKDILEPRRGNRKYRVRVLGQEESACLLEQTLIFRRLLLEEVQECSERDQIESAVEDLRCAFTVVLLFALNRDLDVDEVPALIRAGGERLERLSTTIEQVRAGACPCL
jgi:hypothetical protein